MTALLIMVCLLAAMGLGAARWGADTRDGRDWRPRAAPPGPCCERAAAG